MKTTESTRLVKSEDLNHHGTLFAGRMSEWMIESCFISAAQLYGKPQDIVCVQVHGMNFIKPAHKGDIVTIVTKIAHLGNKSITVHGEVFVNETKEASVNSMATFVTVDGNGVPYAHGMKLPSEYIEANKDIYSKALALKAR